MLRYASPLHGKAQARKRSRGKKEHCDARAEGPSIIRIRELTTASSRRFFFFFLHHPSWFKIGRGGQSLASRHTPSHATPRIQQTSDDTMTLPRTFVNLPW